MERFKTTDVSVIDQKENNPSLAKDEKYRNAQDDNATVNYVPQAGTHLIKLCLNLLILGSNVIYNIACLA